MNELRLGVMGVMGRGSLARTAHKPGEGSRICAVMDNNPKAFEKAREWYGDECPCADTLEHFFENELDGVFLTTPDYLHEEQGLAVLERGLPLYLEKPMAITVEGCDRLLAAAERKKAVLFVGHNMRRMAVFQKMKDLIDAGAVGEVRAIWCRHFINYGGDSYFKDWHAERRNATSLLLQKGAHDIDIIHWLAGAYTNRVTAFGNLSVYNRCARRGTDEPWDKTWDLNHWPPLSQSGMSPSLDVEDHSMVLMALDQNIQASYQQCHYTPDSCRNYTVIGTEGRLENLGDRSDNAVIALWNRRESHRTYRITGQQHYTVQASQGSHDGADDAMVEDFLQCVRGQAEPTVPPLAARQAVAVGCMGAESLRSGGQPLDIPEVQMGP